MSSSGRMCACGGRELLENEVLCPSCERSRHGMGARLVQVGQSIDRDLRRSPAVKLAGLLAAGARAGVEAAAPVIKARAEELRAHGAPLVEHAVERAKVEGVRAALGAISGAEGALGRAKGWLGRK